MTALVVAELTETTLDGVGTYDVLMRANKAHLQSEYDKGRLKGPEYATVYLGAMEAVMQASLAFTLQKRKNDLEAQLLQKQIDLATQEILKSIAETELVEQQTLNAVTENTVLVAQECKLRAEFDVLVETKLKTVEEKALLTWKTTTEKAQTLALGVDADSVIGKQKLLYQAQTDGFARDGEQKATKIMVDSWNVRRTTDEATVADGTNMLNDVAVGRAVTKLLAGIAA